VAKAEILVVEDEGIVAQDIQNTLEKSGYAVSGVAASGEAALVKAEETWPDLVLMDIVLKGDMDGIETARIIHDRFDIPVIYLTAYAHENTLQRAKITDPFGYIVKPFEERELSTAIEIAIHKHHAERRLRDSERHFRSLIENASDLITILDCDGIIRYASPSYQRVLGCQPSELIGQSALEFVHPDDQSEVKEIFIKAAENHTIQSVEFRCRHKGGSWRCFEATTNNRLDDSVVAGIVVNSRDVTERKLAEEAERIAQEQLFQHQQRERERVEAQLAKVSEELVRHARLAAIGQMAASIAHELRHPLTVVRNAAYYLKHQVPPENTKWIEHLALIDREIDTTKRLISNLMEMAHAKEPERQPVDLGKTIKEVFWRIKPDDQVQCHAGLNPDPFVLNVDKVQLRQVLENLMINAIQAMGGRGNISVRARHQGSFDLLIVQDDGQGIPEDLRQQIFEPLISTKPKGTGLGLAICRQIIERHCGTIELFETDAPGAAFQICLPSSKTPTE